MSRDTVASATWKPSFASSAWIRGAPQPLLPPLECRASRSPLARSPFVRCATMPRWSSAIVEVGAWSLASVGCDLLAQDEIRQDEVCSRSGDGLDQPDDDGDDGDEEPGAGDHGAGS